MQTPKTRSNSTTSITTTSSITSGLSFTSISTASSRSEAIMERLLAQETNTAVHLWSTGNLRINTLDLTLGSQDAVEVLTSIRSDSRFEFIDFVHLGEGEEWKASYRFTW